jgi:glycosyltransferase involved in cell wall biosynthesis
MVPTMTAPAASLASRRPTAPSRSGFAELGDDPELEPVAILMPLYNDWASLHLLLDDLDAILASEGITANVVIVDDGSTLAPEEDMLNRDYWALRGLRIVGLRRNLGHQRAIAVGLAYIEAHLPCRAVVLMDSDGEDAPADVSRLLAHAQAEGGRKIVFAERARRSESWRFLFFYNLFRGLHWLLTGTRVRVGNFSVIPSERLASLVVVSELWNHYAAAVFNSRQPFCTIPTARGKRLAGQSRMNFVRLVVHGLSAISVYGEVIVVRLLFAALATLLLSAGGLLGLGLARFVAHATIPLWAIVGVGVLLLLLVQTVMLCAIFSVLVLGGRQGASFLPSRDYAHFVGRVRVVARVAE